MLYSPPKTGKSLLTLEIAYRLAAGLPWWHTPVKPATVLYFDAENDPHTDTIARLKNMGATPDQLDRLILIPMPRLDGLDTPTGAAQALALASHYQPDLIIIDTLARFVDGEENSNDTYNQLYRHFLAPVKKMGIAGLRLDHTGKDESKGQRGASAKVGDVDLVLRLSTVSDGHLRLVCEDHRFPLEEDSFNLARLENPLRHEWEDWRAAMDAKEAEFNRILDEAGAPRDISRRQAAGLARQAGLKVRNDDVGRWLQKRRTRPVVFAAPTLGVLEGGEE